MRNQAYSDLYQEYRSQVEDYKAYSERIVKTKVEMAHFWKYKNDYPADWRRMAEKLSDDRNKVSDLKSSIRSTKNKMRKSNSEHPQK